MLVVGTVIAVTGKARNGKDLLGTKLPGSIRQAILFFPKSGHGCGCGFEVSAGAEEQGAFLIGISDTKKK